MGRTSRLVVGTILLLLLTPASAQDGERDPMRLGQDLTPVGAERAGNASGTIPEWTGGLSEAPADWKVGDPRTDPFAADAPLFTNLTEENSFRYKNPVKRNSFYCRQNHLLPVAIFRRP